MTYTRATVQQLAATDARIRTLYTEHKAFENRLATLESQVTLTPSEEIERRDLQKLKLHRKDQLMRLVAQHDLPAP